MQKLVGNIPTGVILKDVTLEVYGGELMAILGSKGEVMLMSNIQIILLYHSITLILIYLAIHTLNTLQLYESSVTPILSSSTAMQSLHHNPFFFLSLQQSEIKKQNDVLMIANVHNILTSLIHRQWQAGST